MTETIVVAGATGTNGRALIAALGGKDVSIRALARDPAKAAKLESDNVSIVEADLADAASLDRAMDGADRAFALSPVSENAVEWFDGFFAAAKHAGLKHVVKLSGQGAAADSPSRIIRDHFATDELLRASGIAYTILRPNSFCQNMFHSAASIKRQSRFYQPIGDAHQALIDVRDIAEVAAMALTNDEHFGKTYVLTGPERLSFHDVAAQLSETIGKEVSYVPVTIEATKKALHDAGMPPWFANALAELYGVFATGAYGEVTDVSAGLLGRAPRSFAQFAADFADRFR